MLARTTPSRWVPDALLVGVGLGGCYAFGYSTLIAPRLGMTAPEDALSVGVVALGLGAAAFGLESLRLMMALRRRARRMWAGAPAGAVPLSLGERGSMVVEFALIFPLLLWLLSMVFQMALFANASLVTKYACFVACRVAAVNTEREMGLAPLEKLSTQGQSDAKTAAAMVLATISPWQGSADDAGTAMYKTVGRQGGLYLNSTYPRRLDYARANSTITFELKQPPVHPIASAAANAYLPDFSDWTKNPLGNREILCTITYNLYLVIPGIDFLPGMPVIKTSVRGRSERALEIKAAHLMPTTGPREGHTAQAIWAGWFITALIPSDTGDSQDSGRNDTSGKNSSASNP